MRLLDLRLGFRVGYVRRCGGFVWLCLFDFLLVLRSLEFLF